MSTSRNSGIDNGQNSLVEVDPEVRSLILRQAKYERTTLKMIASENFASRAVIEATGSILCNKYAEGYPNARYYEGNEVVDELETLAINRLKKLFGAEHANVQPYSGSPANQAVYRALVKPGDKVMGMALPEGGHLTHGWTVNFSGTDYKRIPYGVNAESGLIDYNVMREIAVRERPKMIWIGATAYPRVLDYAKAAEIAKEVQAYLVADIAHIAGLIAAGVHPNPVPYCDVVSSTSHKTLRGPRGALLMCKIEDRYQSLYHADSKLNLAQRIDRAVFPTLQGGPHLNTIAGLAVALKEAASDSFKNYGKQVVANSRALSKALLDAGFALVSGGSDNHLLILNLKDKPYSGKEAAKALAAAGIIANFNMVPADPRKPAVTSGVRMGTASLTSMGMQEKEMAQVGGFIAKCLNNIGSPAVHQQIRQEVEALCLKFSAPGITDVELAELKEPVIQTRLTANG